MSKKDGDRRLVHGLYKRIDLGVMDKRTKLARAGMEIERSLLADGNHTSVEAQILARQAAELILRLEMFYSTMEPEGSLTLPAQFIACVNALKRILSQLRELTEKDPPIDIESFLRGEHE